MAKSLRNLMGSGLGAQSAKLINGTVADALTATGTVQADALPLQADVNVITTVPSGSGVLLPSSPQPGDETMIANLGANDLLIYPSTGGSLQVGGTNAPVTLPAGASSTFFARPGSRNWVMTASGIGGGGGGAPSGALVGMNESDILYFRQTRIANNLILGNNWEYKDSKFGGSYHDLPEAKLDTHRWPNAVVAGGNYFVKRLSPPSTTADENIICTWTGVMDDPFFEGNFVNQVIGPGNQMTATRRGATLPTGGTIDFLKYAGTNFPTDIKCYIASGPVPGNVTNAITTRHVANMTAVTTSGAPIRMIKLIPSVERNGIFSAGDKGGPSWANRNEPGDGDYYYNDGAPIEVLVALCNSCNRDIYINIPFNAPDDWITGLCTYVLANLTPGLKAYYECVSNEVWNGQYQVRYQAQHEGMVADYAQAGYGSTATYTASITGTVMTVTFVSSGTILPGDFVKGTNVAAGDLNNTIQQITSNGTGAGGTGTYNMAIPQSVGSTTIKSYGFGACKGRWAERHKYVAALIDTIYNDGTKQAKRKRVLCAQNANPSMFSDLMAFTGGSPAGAMTGYVETLASAPYFKYSGSYNDGSVLTAPDLPAFWTHVMLTEQPTVLANALSVKNIATSYGKTYMTYEGGQHFLFSDATTMTLVQYDSGMYTAYMRYMQEYERIIGVASPLTMFTITSGQGAGDAFGVQTYEDQTTSLANTPKMKAIEDYINNIRVAFDVAVDVAITAGPSGNNGDVVGSIKYYTPGAALTTDAPGLAINSANGNVYISDKNALLSAGPHTMSVTQTDSRFGSPNFKTTSGLAYTTIPPLNNTHAYRYYRMNGTANPIQGDIGIDEFQIMAVPGGANTAVGQTASANTTSFGAAANVIDGSMNGQIWVSTALPGIVTVDYGATAGNWIAANQFKIIARNDGAFSQGPTAFTIDGSDNNSSWTTLVSQSGLSWSQGETKTYTV